MDPDQALASAHLAAHHRGRCLGVARR
jgi:hypothetical protein